MAWKPDYVTAEQLGDYLRLPADDDLDAVQLQVWATAASRAVDGVCNRQFGQLSVPAARVYRRPAVYDVMTGLWLVEVDDLEDIVGFTINGVAYASSGAVLLPDNAPADGVPYERVGFTSCPTGPMVGVGRWGWSAVPTAVTGAVYLQAARWNARRDSPLGVAGSPEDGSELRLLDRLDPDVTTTLPAALRRRRRAG